MTGNTSNSGQPARHRSEKAAIRSVAREQRRGLARPQRQKLDAAIRRHIARLPAYRHARSIAIYLEFDGEPSITALIGQAAGRGKRFVVPVLTRANMRLKPIGLKPRWRKNWFGIREPRARARTVTRRPHVVLTPLVAFDRSGARLGMGGGYYDRYFAPLRERMRWSRPKLIGVAYGFQEVEQLPRDAWDVPLWGVVTEHGFIRCQNRR